MDDCIFCKIIDGSIPCNKVYEDDEFLAFYDVAPAAPTHVLIIPKQHAKNVLELDATTFGKSQPVIDQIVKQLEIKNGFRLVINTGEEGGQTVGHFHMHFLAGRDLQWPPG